MPWQEVNPMEQKVLFIVDWIRNVHSVSTFCEVYVISRKTGYKWIDRFNQLGVDGLHDATRKSHQSPQRTPYAIRAEILRLRHRRGLLLGPKKIQVLLQHRFPNESLPSKTTIYNILHAEGLVSARRR
jgi:transposase